MSRVLAILISVALVCGWTANAEDTVNSATNEAKAPEKAAAKVWPVAPKPGPLLAKVVLVNDRTLDKCWVKVLSRGAWVVMGDAYCWFPRSGFKEISYLNEEPSDALKKSLEVVEAKRKASMERQRKADEARAKAVAEKKKGEQKPVVARAGDGIGTGTGTASNSVARGHTNRGTGIPGFDRRNATASRRVGSGSGGSGASGGYRRPGYVRHYYHSTLLQWLVIGINHKAGTVKLRNRRSHEEISLGVDDLGELEGIKRGDILVGLLDISDPHLTVKKDGRDVAFKPTKEGPKPPTDDLPWDQSDAYRHQAETHRSALEINHNH